MKREPQIDKLIRCLMNASDIARKSRMPLVLHEALGEAEMAAWAHRDKLAARRKRKGKA